MTDRDYKKYLRVMRKIYRIYQQANPGIAGRIAAAGRATKAAR